MNYRRAKNRLTGREPTLVEAVVGYRQDGAPGATLHVMGLPGGSVSLCFSRRENVDKWIEALRVVKDHLETQYERSDN